MQQRWLPLARFGGMLVPVLVLCAFIPISLAAGGQPSAVTISGPGLQRPIIVTDPLALPALGIASLMDVRQPIPAPTVLGSGYDVQRNDFDHALYYPGTNLNVTSMHYLGLVNGASEYDDHWYRVSPTGDETMRRILAQQGIDLPGNSPGTVAIARGATAPGETGATTASAMDTAAVMTRTVYPPWPIAALSVGIVAAATGGYAVGRKRR